MSAQEKGKPSFLDIIGAARASEQETDNTSNTENQNTGKPEMVNLTIKVSKARRKHWGLEAKKNNTNLTQVIIEALIAKYGDAD
ncbi:MAG: hypothetical protein ACK456_00775 [Pseudanabaenaceae cyanobacterium]|jgi:hypothetical protein